MPEAPEIAGFHHTALLYASDDEYLAGTVPFLRAGLETGDAAYVVVGADRLELLRSALGPDAAEVRFDDMADVGCNPARIIPAWQDFVDEHPGRGLRGIGEPIFAARTPAEVVECERHEALLNLAFARTPSFTLLCPYDTVALDPAVVEHASCTHPHVRAAGAERASGAYGGDTAAQAPFATPLQAPGAPASALAFDGMMLAGVRRMVGDLAAHAGVTPEQVDDLVLAVSELAANSVRHGGGEGLLTAWAEADAFVCEIADRGRIADPLAGRRRPRPGQVGGYGLWLANQLCDLVQVRTLASGTVIRVHMALT